MLKHGMKIMIVTDTLCDANGVSRFIQDIAAYALKEEKSLQVLTSTYKSYCDWQSNMHNIKPLFRISMPYYKELDVVFVSPIKIYRYIKKHKPDILHISTPGAVGLSGLISAKLLKIPYFGTYHTDFPSYIYSNTGSRFAQRVARGYMKFFYRKFSGIFVRSQSYKMILQEELGFEEKMIHTLFPGIDTHRCNPQLKDDAIWQDYGIPSGSRVALYVGRVSVEKNIPFLLEVWQEIHKKYPDVYLVLVGSGHFYAQKEKYAAYNIHFLGHKEGHELAQIYASSDFFCFPSVTDTLGQVVMEAMASALPVIVSDKGGPKTLVNQKGKDGYIVAVEEKEAFRLAIEELIENEVLRESMSKQALDRSEAFSFSHSFTHFWSIHEDFFIERR
ncbi:MAG: glycosyltransferase family 1 protein [Campylobacterota bacterium]|nr:glycosyltransferase family 1 protein [Campylobacterota bacterium]